MKYFFSILLILLFVDTGVAQTKTLDSLMAAGEFAKDKLSNDEDIICIIQVREREPIFPGCDENMSNEALKWCMSKKIQEHINDNFDMKNAKKYGTIGKNRIYVRFAITNDGRVTDVKARSSNPELSELGKNVIKSLPQMKPGIEKGKAVDIIYTVPINFTLPEEKAEDEK